MPDVITPAAESSTAVEVPQDPEAYANWRQTGKLPAAKPAPAPAPEKPEGEGSAPSNKSEKGAPAPEAGNQQQEHNKPKPSKAEARLNEILEDLKRAGLSPAELKTFKREVQGHEQQDKTPPKAAPEKTDKPAEAPKKPKPEDFETWEKYEEARDQYYEALADFKAQKRLEEFARNQRMDAAKQELIAKVEQARERYGAEAEKTIQTAATAVFTDDSIPAAVKQVVDDSPVLVDLLYVMGSKPEDFQEFLNLARTNPAAAIRKAVLVEQLVTEELKSAAESGATQRDDQGKFTKAAPAKDTTTKAPPPPTETSGRGAAPPDEIDSALKNGDFTAFKNAANRRDIARRRGQ